MKNGETKSSRRSLLIIDDEKDVLYSFRRLLGSEDYEVRSAGNGAEGLRMFREHRPDLVLMDVRMPEMDGMAALAEIRTPKPLSSS